MVIIDAEHFDAVILDLDGVVTQTASLHARAWKRLFDEFLAQNAAPKGVAFKAFNLEADYRQYVDGKPRIAGLLSFLTARGIDLPMGTPEDHAGQMTAHGLARKERYFVELLAQEDIEVFAPTVAFLKAARSRGLRLAVASSSHHCAEVLRSAGLMTLFDVRVDGVDLDRLHLSGKPAPDMFREAARRLGVPPDRAAVFEDATAGTAAARAGGFGLVIGVGRAAQAAALYESGANYLVSDLSEVSLQGCYGARRP
jgi:trehalose 6-phosphate phosphatase